MARREDRREFKKIELRLFLLQIFQIRVNLLSLGTEYAPCLLK